ncbi:hypothetical protein GOX01_22010 [Gluconobacter oxydans]|nr:hypothetical protein GOX01_22010 [Gluconobacter oxydans]
MRGTFNALALYRYAEARAEIDALKAYLGGAEDLKSWNEDVHRARMNDDEVSEVLSKGTPIYLAAYRASSIRTAVTVLRVLRDILSFGRVKAISAYDPIVRINAASWKVGTVRRPEQVQIDSGRNVTELKRDPAQARAVFLDMFRILWFSVTHPAPKPEDFLRLATPAWWNARLKAIIRKT